MKRCTLIAHIQNICLSNLPTYCTHKNQSDRSKISNKTLVTTAKKLSTANKITCFLCYIDTFYYIEITYLALKIELNIALLKSYASTCSNDFIEKSISAKKTKFETYFLH